jgi:hypothetical protein
MGLVILLIISAYLLISAGVVSAAILYAQKHGKSAIRWGASAALVMFLIPGWDWMPTVVAHKYYCEKEAGFWVYKTLDQWKVENPGVMETLVANKGAPSREERFDDGHGRTDTYLLNDRFNWIVNQQDISPWLPIILKEQQVKDVQKNEVLARYVDFASGNSVKNTIGPPGSMKFWLRNTSCIGGERNQGLMYSFEHNIRGAEK